MRPVEKQPFDKLRVSGYGANLKINPLVLSLSKHCPLFG